MRPELPTSVVTLLFTDIEGSTRLLAESRADYVDVLAAHRSTSWTWPKRRPRIFPAGRPMAPR